MDFEFTEEQKMLKKTAHDFWEKEIDPIVDEREKGGTFTKEEYHHYLNMLLPLGYVIGPNPEEYGGAGLSWSSYAILLEESAYWWPSLSSVIATIGGGEGTISRMNDKLKTKYAKHILSLEMLGCSGISEPNVGSAAPRGIEMKAVLQGDYWILNGTKTWTSNGCVSDYINVLCLLDRGKGVEGIGNIFVDRVESPYETREMHKIGWRCSSFSETSFSDCRVPKGNLLSGTGDVDFARGINFGRASLSVRATGLAQAAFDKSIDYARERKQFGKPIGAFQLVQDMLVDMATDIDCSRFLAYRAYDALDRQLPLGETRKYVSMAKAFATEAVNRVAYKAVQIHGAVGIQTDARLERYYRDARPFTIPDGTTQIHKLIVGRELTGLNALR
jgi:alkylation response protein AidB-like acyl-CoA dehydrogenase